MTNAASQKNAKSMETSQSILPWDEQLECHRRVAKKSAGDGSGAGSMVRQGTRERNLRGQPQFHRRRNARLLEGPRTLCTEFVALNGDSGAPLVAAHHAAVNHQLHRAGIVQPKRPVHRQFHGHTGGQQILGCEPHAATRYIYGDRKSTRLNSSHLGISYAVFCLKKKKQYVLLCT